MTVDEQEVGHGGDQKHPSKSTVRLQASHFDDLSSWAEKNQLSDIFLAVALTFGFTENFTIIGNLNRELSHPESQNILGQWSDNPLASSLAHLHRSYVDSPDISSKYPGINHAGDVKKTTRWLRSAGAKIKKRHFLLRMITNPLARAPNESLYHLRRTFRLWLIIQALERTVERHCCSDSKIQFVASRFTLDAQHSDWLLIDEVLRNTADFIHQPTFSQFTLALLKATGQLIPNFSDRDDLRNRELLKTTITIAEGHCNPIDGESAPPISYPDFASLKAKQNWLSLTGSDWGFSQALTSPQESEEDEPEESEQALLYEVDTRETPENQRLTGQSILLQSSELSHYLPWSWGKALPPEIDWLGTWLDQKLEVSDPLEQLGAAVVWFAIRFGRSLPFVLEFLITDHTLEEWSLSTDFTTAHRRPPKRQSSWVPKSEVIEFIEDFEDQITVKLPVLIAQILQSAAANLKGATRSLHEIWFQQHTQTPEKWFTGHAKVEFPRLSSAKLANIHSQVAFNKSGDHSFARLISAHPRSAIPAACGYSNWDIRQVRSEFALEMEDRSKGANKRINLLGSLLAPIESFLIDHIRTARSELEAMTGGDPIAYHNSLARYTVTALYAATGCRYLTDPFESLSLFCETPPAVYINDKSDDGIHNGRMVLLPDKALAMVMAYRKHLATLIEPLQAQHPALADRLEQLIQGRTTTLPLFFLLDRDGNWYSPTQTGLPGNDLFDWPLPKNLFRHRFAQQLTRKRVQFEIIDGLMGHAERGVGSYGDMSPRCWIDDAVVSGKAINDCFDQLGFEVPKASSEVITLRKKINSVDGYRDESKLFGERRREAARRLSRRNAKKSAKQDLELFLAAHPVENLDQSYVDKLANLMVIRENGLPRTQAALRFEVLLEWLESEGVNHCGFIRRRMAKIESERSKVRRNCPKAISSIPLLQNWASKTKVAIRQLQLSKAESLFLAVLFVAIEKRISYPKLLQDLAQGENYRLIQTDRQIFLEYNEALEPDNYYQPVQRHEIDHTTARLLGRGLGSAHP